MKKTIQIRLLCICLAMLGGLLCIGCRTGGSTEQAVPQQSAGPAAQTLVLPVSTADSAAGVSALSITPVGQEAIDPKDANILFINVGKADAALVLYGGMCALIDTGTAEAAPQLFAALERMGITSLDMVFLTHIHSDHIGGMQSLGRYFPVGQMYGAVYSENKKNGENKIALLSKELSIPLTRLRAGEKIAFGDAAFTVLGPLSMNEQDDNDNSLVLRLEVNGRSVLFAGDMQFGEEQTLLDAGADVSVDILKVGNHGNPDATGDDFGKAVSPSIGVISTDTAVDTDSANPRVIAALSGATVLRTQDTDLGVLLRIKPTGETAILEPIRQSSALALSIQSVTKQTQQIVVVNQGDSEADISGCMLLSERGGELFRFPEGSNLAMGESVCISGENGDGDYSFIGEDTPISKKKADTVMLYDRFGNELSRCE